MINTGTGDDVAWGGDGNDNIQAGGKTAYLHGEAGDDYLNGFHAGQAWLYGGDGNDNMILSSNGYAYGGDGDDRLTASDSSWAWLQGGAGDDDFNGGTRYNLKAILDYSDVTTFITVDLGLTTWQDTHGAGSDRFSNLGNLVASGGDDTVIGSFSGNYIRGEAGDDTLTGQQGDDLLVGGLGNDRLNGAQDQDVIAGDAGDDVIDGGTGSDAAVFSGRRADYSISMDGDVTVVTGPDGTDRLSNVEMLLFSDGVFGPSGGALTGSLPATDGADTIQDSSGNDLILGLGGDDVVSLTSGSDFVFGGEGIDTVVIGANQQEFSVTEWGGVTVINGLGSCYVLKDVEYVRFANHTLIPGQNDGHLGIDTAANDQLFGTPGNDELRAQAGKDTLMGFAGDDRLSGGDGDDVLFGGDGNDVLNGGLGDDVIDGGAGQDTLTLQGARDSYRILSTGGGFLVKGPDGSDVLTGIEILRFGDRQSIDLHRFYADDAGERFDDFLVLPGPGAGSGVSKGEAAPEVLPGLVDNLQDGLEPMFSLPFRTGRIAALDDDGPACLLHHRVGGGWDDDGCAC